MFTYFRRNDIISNVREAALVALKNIGGDKAENAIRVTQVLEKEIRRLKQSWLFYALLLYWVLIYKNGLGCDIYFNLETKYGNNHIES